MISRYGLGGVLLYHSILCQTKRDRVTAGNGETLNVDADVICRYVCGNTATAAGLTVTLVKEGGSGDYALEAGALVLGDQGAGHYIHGAALQRLS
jgi:hypothetical protein